MQLSTTENKNKKQQNFFWKCESKLPWNLKQFPPTQNNTAPISHFLMSKTQNSQFQSDWPIYLNRAEITLAKDGKQKYS